ncbi:MAG: plasmid stabilization protein [Gammaproteobacteria bacterium]
MSTLTVRNVPAEVHRALRMQAAMHGHSTEAEVREILANSVKPKQRVHMGDALSKLGRQIGLKTENFAIIEQICDKTPAKPVKFK